MFDTEWRVGLAGFAIGQLFQFVFIVFLTNELLFKRHSELQQAYYYILYISYIMDTLDNIAWFYDEAVGYKVGDIGVAMAQAYISYYIYSIGTSVFLLSFNRFTAIAYPSIHLRFWTGKSLYVTLYTASLLPFFMEVYEFTNIDCKFYPFIDKCESIRMKNLLIRTIYNIILSAISLIIVTFAVLKTPKHSSALAKIERKSVIYTMTTSFFVIVYALTYYLSHTVFKDEIVGNIGFLSFGIHQYVPTISLLFLNAIFRDNFLRFLKVDYFWSMRPRVKCVTVTRIVPRSSNIGK